MLIVLLLVIVVLGGVPKTRYALAGLVLKQNVTIAAIDAQTQQPVSSATITLGGKTAATDGQGRVTIRVSVGDKTLNLFKKYYSPLQEKILVPIRKPKPVQVRLTATGRQVPIVVTDKISGKALQNVTVKALDTEAKTDDRGHATLVLPADKTTAAATVSVPGYNDLSATVQITAQSVPANTFNLTPAGSLYFLSNLSGKIDVVKTNLDGTNRQTVLAGTGQEDATNTVLLASRDWKYLALLSKRDGTPKLYLITPATNALMTMDEGAGVAFTPVGWSDDTFIYTLQRSNLQNWQSGQGALKSFNAANQKLAMLDQTSASGVAGPGDNQYTHEIFGSVSIFPNNEVVYVKNVSSSFPGAASAQAALYSINADGSNKRAVKSWGVPSGNGAYSILIDTSPESVSSLYVRDPFASPSQYYEYEDGQLKNASGVNDQTFYAGYPTELLSPSGTQTFWSDVRDGQTVLFLGDGNGQNGKQLAGFASYQVYGWYTDNYLLVSKNSSELYIMPVSGSTQPLKVSDYYKPQTSFPGYGGGYGGL